MTPEEILSQFPKIELTKDDGEVVRAVLFSDAVAAMRIYSGEEYDGCSDKKWKAEQFEIFWKKYNKKVGKKNALAQWMKLKKNDIEKILATVDEFLAYKPFESYTHPDPERYIKHRRFDDELPKKQSVAHVMAEKLKNTWSYEKTV